MKINPPKRIELEVSYEELAILYSCIAHVSVAQLEGWFKADKMTMPVNLDEMTMEVYNDLRDAVGKR